MPPPLHSLRRIGFLGLCLVVIGMSGCKTIQHPPPIDELTAAHQALASAWEAGGDVFSPDKMIHARSLLEQSLEAYDNREFLSARLYAERATADARLAMAVTETERERFYLNTLLAEIRAYRDTIDQYRIDRTLLEQELSPLD